MKRLQAWENLLKRAGKLEAAVKRGKHETCAKSGKI